MMRFLPLACLAILLLVHSTLSKPSVRLNEESIEELEEEIDELEFDLEEAEDKTPTIQTRPEKRYYGQSGQSRTHSNSKILETERNGGALLRSVNMDTLDPDSSLAYLLETMIIGRTKANGKATMNEVPGCKKLAMKAAKLHGDVDDKHKFTNQQKAALGMEGVEKRRRQKRNFWRTANTWPGGIIPYQIDSSLSSSTYVKVIEDSAKSIADLTCVKWVKRTDPLAQNLGHNDFVSIFSESGCWSYVGKLGQGQQNISLQAPGCVTIPTTIHEMGHAMGQMHEQSRSDRDSYIDMFFDNIQGGTGNFNMEKVSTYDYNPYDQESVLQYSLYAFAIDRSKPAMLFKDQRLNFLANQENGLTFYDIQDVIDGYGCTSQCSNPPTCQNGGFLNHQCVCYCPDGMTGTNCEQTTSAQACGAGIIDLVDGQPQTITSPNYPNPYPTSASCVWMIRAPQGRHVRMTIVNLDLPDNGNSCDHWLEVQYNLIGQTGIRHCGASQGIVYLTSDYGDVNLMMLKFDNSFASDVAAGPGFTLTLETASASCLSGPCQNGGTCTDLGFDSYSCACKAGFSGTRCEVVDDTVTLSCDFEDSVCGIFADATDDNFDWTRNGGSTPSSNTGPSGAQGGSTYLYAEMSSPRVQGDVARYETAFALSARDRCLRFWYNMYGGSVGELRVYTTSTASPSRTTVWSQSGDKGNTWFQANVDLSSTAGLKVGFEAVRGSSWNSDIAIDTVSLEIGTCSGITQAPTTQAPTTQAPTTQAPTTQAPTTQAPTTQAPTTQAPTTQAPTTQAPTTQAPTTQAPTTQAPTTQAPTTQAPTTTTILPVTTSTTQAPTTQSPTTQAPTTQAPTTQAPTTQAPTTQAPTTQAPNTITLPASCTFESGSPCFLSDVSYDDFDWTERTGSTPSSGTGPSSAVEGAYYRYIETSSPRSSGDTAIMESGVLPAGQDMCLTFQYHMYGTSIGSFNVLREGASSTSTLLSDSNDHGDLWNKAVINLQAGESSILKFEGVRGSSYRGDVAVDDVSITSGTCSGCLSDPCLNGGTCVDASGGAFSCLCPADYSGPDCSIFVGTFPTTGLSCTFEPGATCFLSEVSYDDFDWTERSGSTPSSSTGPDGAIEGAFYKYTETSSPRVSGNQAILESTTLPSSMTFCLSFYYHMYGSSMGGLKVIESDSGAEVELFSLSGEQGNAWLYAEVDVTSRLASKLLIVGVRGSSYRGDIAIDDVLLMSGTCGSGQTGPTTAAPTSDTCTFEPGSICFLSESQNDDFDWTQRTGSTPSSNTGPSTAAEGSYYKYIETSSPRTSGDEAVLESQQLSGTDQCLQFSYNMNGDGIGGLSIEQDDGMSTTSLFFEDQDLGDVWLTEAVNVPALAGSKLLIRGTRGNNYKGDIAIDDLRLADGKCQCSTVFNPCENGGICEGFSAGGAYNCTCPAPFTGPLCEINGNPPIHSCDFEQPDSCFITNVGGDQFDWSFASTKTPSGSTGPSVPHSGQYAYIEASSPRRRGDTALLSTNGLALPSGDLCLSFYYNMNGRNIRKLVVLSGQAGQERKRWQMVGNQGDVWVQESVTIPSVTTNDQSIIIKGIRGNGYRGDIAIDDVELTSGPCQ